MTRTRFSAASSLVERRLRQVRRRLPGAGAGRHSSRPAVRSGSGPGASDLRLVALATAAWLAALACLPTRASVAVGAAAAALTGAVGLWRWVAGRRPGTRSATWGAIVIAVLLGAGCGAAATAPRLAARDATPVAEAAARHATVTAELTVRRDPRQLRHDPGTRPGWLVPAWLHRLGGGAGTAPVQVRARVLVLTGDPGWQPLLPGERVRATGTLAPARGGDLTAAVLSADGPPERLAEPPWWQRSAGALRAGLQSATAPLPAEPGGLLPGLAVGDVSNLDPALTDDFYTTGMTHLVAVSGSNVVIVIGFVALIARAGRAPPWLTASLCAAALVGFVILCRPDPSVLRAGAMGAIGLVALATGRSRAAMPALAATVTLLVLLDPQLAGEPGFALSVLATGGLLLLAPRWRDALRRRGVPPGIAEALTVPAAAQLAVAPVIAGLSGTVSLVAIGANLAAAPAVAPATILGVSAAAISPAFPAAAEFLAWLGSFPAWWLVLVARYGAQAPAAVVPWPAGVAGALLLTAVTVALLLALRHRRLRALVAVVAAAVVVGTLPVKTVASGWPPAGAVAAACAVGQGDLVVLPLGQQAAVVVDAGPEPAAADRCLRDLRVRSVPLLVISHFHADHVGGIKGVFRGRAVASVLTTGLPEPELGHELVTTAASAAATPVQVARAGARYQVGDVSLTVLGPPHELVGTRSDPNNNSLVIMAEVRGVRVLLPGDAETELQQALLAEPGAGRLRADLLKVAHHGSAFQEPEFIDAVSPAVAMVPVGADNSYGHPHPAVLDRLTRGGARLLRTDTDGDVAAVLHQGELAVVTRAPPPNPGRRNAVKPSRPRSHQRHRRRNPGPDVLSTMRQLPFCLRRPLDIGVS